MRFSTVAAAALVPVGLALAQNSTNSTGPQTHFVTVGADGQKAYNPTSIQAVEGDSIEFQFLAGNHTATQSSFPSPCTNFTDANGQPGVDSGFQFVNGSSGLVPTWTITVQNTSAPLWFHCRQTGHCAAGMVFAVNPIATKTFAQFQLNAMNASASNSTASNSTSAGASPTSGGASGPSGANAVASNTASSGTPSPSISGTSNNNNNGASSVRVGSAAGLLLSTAALAFALL